MSDRAARFAALLSERAFRHRLDAIGGTLFDYGEVHAYYEDVAPTARRLLARVELPGWGQPIQGSMVLIEGYRALARDWELVLYEYDYHREPRPCGRKGHHWHGGVYHIHCADPRHPRPDHRFRGFSLDLLEAAREFAEMYASGMVNCAGLFPLR